MAYHPNHPIHDEKTFFIILNREVYTHVRDCMHYFVDFYDNDLLASHIKARAKDIVVNHNYHLRPAKYSSSHWMGKFWHVSEDGEIYADKL